MLRRVYSFIKQNAVFGSAILRLYFVSEISMLLFRVKFCVQFIPLY